MNSDPQFLRTNRGSVLIIQISQKHLTELPIDNSSTNKKKWKKEFISKTFLNFNNQKLIYRPRVVHVYKNNEQLICRNYNICIQKIKSEDNLNSYIIVKMEFQYVNLSYPR